MYGKLLIAMETSDSDHWNKLNTSIKWRMDCAKGSSIMCTEEAMIFHNLTWDSTGSTISKFYRQGSLASNLMARLWTSLQGQNCEVKWNPELLNSAQPKPMLVCDCFLFTLTSSLWVQFYVWNCRSFDPTKQPWLMHREIAFALWWSCGSTLYFCLTVSTLRFSLFLMWLTYGNVCLEFCQQASKGCWGPSSLVPSWQCQGQDISPKEASLLMSLSFGQTIKSISYRFVDL